MTSTNKITFGSLFAGVGGFDLGFEAAGWQCAFQVEKDETCRKVLARHWPEVIRMGDVQEVSGASLPSVDCISFGSPCQDLSVGGKRAGLAGDRSGLFREAIRVILEMQDATNGAFPRWAIWENVAGALISNQGADFAEVLTSMADLGSLVVEWAVLDSRNFGVPQRRQRVFVIACLDPVLAAGCPDPLLPLGPRVRGSTSPFGGEGFANPSATAVGSTGDVPAIGFNWANGGGYGNAGPGLGITVDGTGPLSTSQVIAVAQGGAICRKIMPIEAERLMGWPDDHTRWLDDGTEVPKTRRYKMCGNGVASPVAEWVANRITLAYRNSPLNSTIG